MQLGELLPGLTEGPKPLTQVLPPALAPSTGRGRRCGERNPRQLALEVVGIFLAIVGMVQRAIDVVEDGPLVDILVVVVLSELLQRPIGNVLAAVRAVFVV